MSLWDSYDLRTFIPDNGARKDYGSYSVDRCPFHDDSRPSMIIYPRRWECKAGCGSGDVVEWVCRTRGVGRGEAISMLRGSLPEPKDTKWTPKPKVRTEQLDQSLGLQYHLNLHERERAWYRWRGLTDETINRRELGYGIAPGGRNGRFTIPIYDEMGRLANVKFREDDRCPSCFSPWTFKGESDQGFTQNEWYCADCQRRWVLDGNKYVGLKGHGEPRLFNMDALVMARRVFIVEGEFDAIMMHQRGYSAVSSTGGCNSFPMSFAVHFLHSARVYVCYDHDDGGEEGMRHVQEVVPKARILKLPLGRKGDVSDFLRWHTNDEFEDLVRQSDGGGSYLLKASNGMIHDMGLLCR